MAKNLKKNISWIKEFDKHSWGFLTVGGEYGHQHTVGEMVCIVHDGKEGCKISLKSSITSLIAKERQEERERIIKIGWNMIDGCVRRKCFKNHEAVKDYIKNIRDL